VEKTMCGEEKGPPRGRFWGMKKNEDREVRRHPEEYPL